MQEDMGIVRPLGPADGASFTAALTIIGTAQATLLLFPGTWTFPTAGGNVTVPDNVTVFRTRGAFIVIEAGVTLTIPRLIDAASSVVPDPPSWKSGAGTLLLSATASGMLALQNDGVVNRVRYATGRIWAEVGTTALDVRTKTTGGIGTVGSPFTGWEAAVSGLPDTSRVYFPAGHYTINPVNAPVTLKKESVYEGDGMVRSFITVAGASKGFAYEPAILTDGDIELRNLMIFGQVSSSLELVSFKNTGRIRVHDCSIRNSLVACLKLETVFDSAVYSNHIASIGANGHALWIKSCNNWSVLSNTFGMNGVGGLGDLIWLQNSGWGGVMLNVIEGESIAQHGIHISGCSCVDINRNFIEFVQGNPIRFDTSLSNHIDLIGNHVNGATTEKIDLAAGGLLHTDIRILHNRAVQVTGHVAVAPGATTGFVYRHGSIENGSHVFGFSEVNVDIPKDALRQRIDYPIQVVGISGTPSRANNLRGSVLISGTATSGSVNFASNEQDTSYFVVASVATATVGASLASKSQVWIDGKTIGGFVVWLGAAPGTGESVTVNWILVR